MPLTDLRILSVESGQVAEGGAVQYVVTYKLPAERVRQEEPYYRPRLENRYPFAPAWDPLPPCIHSYRLQPTDSGDWWKLVCVYRRPTMQMILQPGRGWFYLDSYNSSRSRNLPVLSGKAEAHGLQRYYEPPITGDFFPVSSATTEYVRDYEYRRWLREHPLKAESIKLQTERVSQVVSHGTLVVMTCDWFTEYWDLVRRAIHWIGKGGIRPIKIGKLTFTMPRLAAVHIEPRRSDASIVDCKYKFNLRSTEWLVTGGIIELRGDKVVRRSTAPRIYEAVTRWPGVGRAKNPWLHVPETENSVLRMQVINSEAEAVTGWVDFGDDWDSYFSWMPRDDLEEYRERLGVTPRIQGEGTRARTGLLGRWDKEPDVNSIVRVHLTAAEMKRVGLYSRESEEK